MKYRTACFGIWMIFSPLAGFSQQSLQNQNPSVTLESAMDLMEKQQYHAAMKWFESLETAYPEGIQRDQARFYKLYSALCVQEPFAHGAMQTWLDENPGHPLSQQAYFRMGRSYYAAGDYLQAEDWFGKVNVSSLSRQDEEDFWFEYAHAQFLNGKNLESMQGFLLLSQRDSRYKTASLYFLAHLDFQSGSYEKALAGFEALQDDPQFGPVVPYYIAQIYFALGQYDRVLSYAVPLADRLSAERRRETWRVIGASYFKTDQYERALSFLENYIREVGGDSQDKYYLGMAYYRLNQYDHALGMLEKITPEENLLGQNVLYHLGDLYARKGDKSRAALAFSSASSMSFDPSIQEDALFNYAVSVYESGFSPFTEVTSIFEDYLKRYPESLRRQEVYRYLADAYLSSKNYALALSSLDKITQKDDALKKATQRVALFMGLTRFNDLQFAESIRLFDQSLQYAQYDNLLSARAAFWKAEAFYRTGDYQGSASLYRRFLSMAGASRTEEYPQAFYNLGYALFKTQEYSGALDQYSRYVALENAHAQQKISDAWNRMGDCRFMLQSYAEAAKSYERAASMGQSDSDYALFQQAFCYGLMQQQDRKIETLGRLIASFPASSRIPAALFETGRAYVVSGRPGPASLQFQELIRRFPSGSYTGKAYLELALIAYNGGNNDEAIRYYKQVVSSFPESEDARSALLGLRNVYSDLNEGETFLQYAASLGGSLGNISASEQETISFRSAQNLYIQKEYEKAVPGLIRYLDRFPDGSFAANARYFLADCYERSGRHEESLVLYEQVASSRNSFTVDALSAAAGLRFQREEWGLALDLYRRLLAVAEISDHVAEARIGEMRCAYILGQYEQSLSSSEILLLHDKSSPEIIRESGFTQARSLLGLQRQEEALDAFRKVAEDIKSQEGAESKFRVIEILYGQRKLDEAESEVFDFVSKNPGHTYWLAKAFLLLSDIYIIRHDVFQASQTLQSLIENYENQEDGIIQSAREKKAALENLQES